MRVVVTGAQGFIGSAVVRELEQRNREVVTFDRREGHDILTDPIPPCDAVIHLAGVLGTAELFDQAEHAIETNCLGTLRILEQCVSFGASYTGITMPRVFPSIYTATKTCAEELATAFHHAYGLPVSHVRAFNAFGEGQHLGPVQKIVPTFADRAWKGLPLPIWGSGEQTCDLVYTGDLARMLVEAIDFGDNEVFDGGTGEAVTVNQVAWWVLNITGSKSEVKHLPMRKGEVETNIVAQGEGWGLLGWKPEFRRGDFIRTVESYRVPAMAVA